MSYDATYTLRHIPLSYKGLVAGGIRGILKGIWRCCRCDACRPMPSPFGMLLHLRLRAPYSAQGGRACGKSLHSYASRRSPNNPSPYSLLRRGAVNHRCCWASSFSAEGAKLHRRLLAHPAGYHLCPIKGPRVHA